MFLSIVLVIAGIFAIICTIMKPRFYWESRKATRLRRLIGDTAASILYIIIGILASGIGIADLLGIITL